MNASDLVSWNHDSSHESLAGPSLKQRTSSRLREVQPLNREPLQRGEGIGFVDGSFQELFDSDHRDDERAPAW
jgi:hypothetical protein